MDTKPELKQFGDITLEDFDRHPVWIGCHTADYDEPWYEETDEETFRPWTGVLPADAATAMLLVKATFELKDGSKYLGFMTPTPPPGDLGGQQPYLFTGDQGWCFWGGIVGVSIEERQALYAALGKKPGKVFPLRFSAEPGLATGETSGQIDGFYQAFGNRLQIDL